MLIFLLLLVVIAKHTTAVPLGLICAQSVDVAPLPVTVLDSYISFRNGFTKHDMFAPRTQSVYQDHQDAPDFRGLYCVFSSEDGVMSPRSDWVFVPASRCTDR